MATEFRLPELGENIAGGDLLRILVKVGDQVERDQPVVELETDKATIEVPVMTAGRVTVDGADVRGLRLNDLRRTIGVVSQEPFLFSTTVRENIGYGRPGATDDEIRAAARLARADAFIEALPQGYDTVVGERGLTLSGGQRQRLAIARAVITDPRILILDEATASVDASTEREIQDALRAVMAGRTTVIIAHRLSTIRLADELVVLDAGTVAARGTHAQLYASNPLYRDIHDGGLARPDLVLGES